MIAKGLFTSGERVEIPRGELVGPMRWPRTCINLTSTMKGAILRFAPCHVGVGKILHDDVEPSSSQMLPSKTA
jgi:hypothetical protein